MTKKPQIEIPESVRHMLIENADRYETGDFINGDPSWFMHQVQGDANREAMAFVASCLSYGSRQQFMPKIDHLRQCCDGEMHRWIANGDFAAVLPEGCTDCLYRLYTVDMFHHFLRAYQHLMQQYGTLGDFVRRNAATGFDAVAAICNYFATQGVSVIVPKDCTSACKRVCMFLRWMVRDGSPVDLGLWADAIDRRTLIMPLDTHVLQQGQHLGLLASRTASMAAAQRLTEALATVFPDDPLRGDFALFGYGVEHD